MTEKTQALQALAAQSPAVSTTSSPPGRPIPGEMGGVRPTPGEMGAARAGAGSASGGRAVPGEMGASTGGRISLLGITSAQTGITDEYVQKRKEVGKIQEELQPKIQEQVRKKEQLEQQISDLEKSIGSLRSQMGQAMDALDKRKMEPKDRDAAEKGIRANFAAQVEAVRERQDALKGKQNEADEEIEKLGRDPKLRNAIREMQKQGASDMRKYFGP